MKTKFISIILFAFLMSVLFLECGKTDSATKFINKNNQEESIKIIRFDTALFAKPLPNTREFLKNLQKKYPEMFQTTLDDPQYLAMITQFISDERLRDAQNAVERTYPNLDFIEKDLTSAFAKLQKYKKETTLPKLFSLILGPADFSYMFENRVYTNGQYSTISLDMYSFPALKNNPYYSQVPQYMQETLNKNFIVPDFMKMYLKNVTFSNAKDVQLMPSCTLLDAIVDEGKYIYITKLLLSNYSDAQVLRYTDKQFAEISKHESEIWAYIIQNKLLYEKDRSKYMSLTAEGPTSRPFELPSRVGYFIGYKIVKQFMNEEDITIDSLINLTDSQKILNLSKYKPPKQAK